MIGPEQAQQGSRSQICDVIALLVAASSACLASLVPVASTEVPGMKDVREGSVSTEESQPDPLLQLLTRFQSGESEAASHLFDFFNDHVMRVVHRRLSPSVRTRVDTEDLSQSVWATLWKNRERFQGLDNSDAAMAFIVTIAKRKVAYAMRKHVGSQKRSTQAEKNDESLIGVAQERLLASPSQALQAKELMEKLMDGESERCCKIIAHRMEGLTIEQVAEIVGVDERTVRRTLKRLEGKLGP